MTKRVLLVIFLSILSIGICGCSNNISKENNNSPQGEEAKVQTIKNSSQKVPAEEEQLESGIDKTSINTGKASLEISLDELKAAYYSDFSENLTWITTTDKKAYCIDTDGNVVIRLSLAQNTYGYTLSTSKNNAHVTKYSYVTPFRNGVAAVYVNSKLSFIDKKGEIIGQFTPEENEEIIGVSNDSFITIESTANFNENYLTLNIYNNSGKKVDSSSFDNQLSEVWNVCYLDNGVWTFDVSFNDENYVDEDVDRSKIILYPSNGTEYICEIVPRLLNETWSETLDNWAFLTSSGPDGYSYEDKNNIYRNKLYLFNTENKKTKNLEIPTEFLSSYTFRRPSVSENKLLLENGSQLVLIDVENENISKLDDSLYHRLDGYFDSATKNFSNGAIPLPLEGEDGNRYVALFDSTLNMINEPIICSTYTYGDGILIVKDPDGQQYEAFDTTGESLFSVENDCYYMSEFKCGRVLATKDHVPYYFNEKGESAFDSITINTNKVIDLII